MTAFVPCPALLSARTVLAQQLWDSDSGGLGAVQSPGRVRAFLLPGYLQGVMLGLDILSSHGMEEGCWCAPGGIKPGMEPL